jgi:hypothetical protein
MDLIENYNFHIHFISIRVHTKRLNFGADHAVAPPKEEDD